MNLQTKHQKLLVLVVLISLTAFSNGSRTWEIIGIFENPNSLAAYMSEAAAEFSNSTDEGDIDGPYFTFRKIQNAVSLHLRDGMDLEGQTIIVTGESHYCDQISNSSLLSNKDNIFMVCYNAPSSTTLNHLHSIRNLYISYPSIQESWLCIFKLVRLLLTPAKQSIVSMLIDQDHPFNRVRTNLAENLRPNVTSTILDYVSTSTQGVTQLVLVALPLTTAISEVCNLKERNDIGSELFLIFLGSCDQLSDQLLHDSDCNANDFIQTLKATYCVDYHLHSQGLDDDATTKEILRSIHSFLPRVSTEYFSETEISEALQAHDAVWAITQAITRALHSLKKNGELKTNFSEIVRKKMRSPVQGLLGELIYNQNQDDGIRSAATSSIYIYRWEPKGFNHYQTYFNGSFESLPSCVPPFSTECDSDSSPSTAPTSESSSTVVPTPDPSASATPISESSFTVRPTSDTSASPTPPSNTTQSSSTTPTPSPDPGKVPVWILSLLLLLGLLFLIICIYIRQKRHHDVARHTV